MADRPVIILSRTDSIGDVVLTLPMAGFIKKHLPAAKIIFLGRTYTKDVIGLSSFVDEFINYDELERLSATEQKKKIVETGANNFVHVLPKKELAMLAKRAGVKTRVGTTNRAFHWFTCNKLIKLSRKSSSLHESQLNIKLLDFLNLDTRVDLKKVSEYYGFSKIPALHPEFIELVDRNRINVIFHPRSKGSAKEWGLDNFAKLADLLPESRFKIFVSGTLQDADSMRDFLNHKKINNITGRMPLAQFIAFISHCDALVAASTGPLHIAAALGKKAVGLFSPRRPIHPGRWTPVGKKAHALVFDEHCDKCATGKDCNCITKISPQQVLDLLLK